MGLVPFPALASTTADVVITVTGIVVASPGNFTLTYVSDYELGISWTKPAGAVNTMVRVKYGSLPIDRTDGYQVYYGTDSSFTDSNADLTSPRVAYYRAWSQRADGIWEAIGASKEAKFMSLSYLWIGLVAIALAISALTFIYRRAVLSVLSAGAWMVLMFFAYFNLDNNMPANLGLVGFFLLCMVTMFGSLGFLRPKKEPILPPSPYQHIQDLDEKMEFYRKMRRRT
ncbi:hypothetical protein MUP46_01010 [Patescibacteria group bacterium]|nr:hypothetical protein [Patescibacteria group bacterium]